MHKKKQRFTLKSLLFAVTLAAFACFWVAWPKQTAIAFLIERDAKHKAAGVRNPFRNRTPEFFDFETNRKPMLSKQLRERELDLTGLTPHDRNMMDFLLARQTFDYGMVSLTVCRGRVACRPRSFFGVLR